MTDKTKPWLTAKHPEAIACKAAGRKLYEELSGTVTLTGVGVGVSADNQRATIRINLLSKDDLSKVPATYDGYEVVPVVTGTIKPL